MKYIKTLALLLSISALTSCDQGFDNFPSDIEQTLETKATEPNDSTGAGQIIILFDEPETENIDCTITI